MNLLYDFDAGLTVREYITLLNVQKSLHDLHYRKAEVWNHKIQDLPELKILVITEPWCMDSTAIMPVLMKLFENQAVEFRIALRDENPALMERFLTNGGKSIPVIIVLDAKGEFVLRFGPRPRNAQTIFDEHRRDIQEGRIERMEVMKKIRMFYSKDRGKAILDDFTGALSKTLNLT